MSLPPLERCWRHYVYGLSMRPCVLPCLCLCSAVRYPLIVPQHHRAVIEHSLLSALWPGTPCLTILAVFCTVPMNSIQSGKISADWQPWLKEAKAQTVLHWVLSSFSENLMPSINQMEFSLHSHRLSGIFSKLIPRFNGYFEIPFHLRWRNFVCEPSCTFQFQNRYWYEFVECRNVTLNSRDCWCLSVYVQSQMTRGEWSWQSWRWL